MQRQKIEEKELENLEKWLEKLLKKEDLLFAEHLLNAVCTKVSEIAQSEGSYCTDKSTYLSALKNGDAVLIRQMSDSKFVIIEKVVSA